MTDPRIERLERHLIRLKMVSTKARLDTILEEGARSQLSFLDFLDKVVGEEVAAKDAKRAIMRTQMAKFPLDRTLESFDFDYQPSLDRRLVAELETGRYLANATNVLLLGPPGVGKTHLAIGLGRKAIWSSPKYENQMKGWGKITSRYLPVKLGRTPGPGKP